MYIGVHVQYRYYCEIVMNLEFRQMLSHCTHIGVHVQYRYCCEIVMNLEFRQMMLNRIHVGLHVQYCYYCQIVMRLEILLQFSDKNSNIKFHENRTCGSRVVAVWTDVRDQYKGFFFPPKFCETCLKTT
jgi:hypothetical protein